MTEPSMWLRVGVSCQPTMQEEAPEAPAQIIRLVILLPQNFLHCSLVSRGREACCSKAGVSAAETNNGNQLKSPIGNNNIHNMTHRMAMYLPSP